MRCYGDKPLSFLAMNPGGGIPVAKINGRIMTESRDILAAIEGAFPEQRPLQPAPGSSAAAVAQPLYRLERELFSCWFRWLTGTYFNLYISIYTCTYVYACMYVCSFLQQRNQLYNQLYKHI
jgi:glutathione S-transferase